MKAEDLKRFTHYGSMYGVPVYLNGIHSDSPEVTGRNFLCDWLLLTWVPVAQFVQECLVVLFYQDAGSGFCIRVDGQLVEEKSQ